MQLPRLTILCPVYNEESVVPLFFGRISPVIRKLSSEYQVNLVFINNASTDNTYSVIEDLRSKHQFVYLISLARNVGYQRSIECGLRNSIGDLFVFIDVDCEDPPEMILDFVEAHKRGYDIVYGERVDREEPGYIKLMRKIFYRITKLVADEEIILDMAEFSLLTSEVRDAIAQDETSFPFIRASIGRVGFQRIGLPYKRHKRIGGQTHYNILGMAKFAIAGILASSTLFLRLPIYLFPLWFTALCIFAYQASVGAAWAIPALLLTAFTYIGLTLCFVAMYVARVYKNGLGRPNAVISHAYSHLQNRLPRRDRLNVHNLAVN